MSVVKVKIRGGRDAKPMCGRDVGIFVIDEHGVERLLPAKRFHIECDGRSNEVRLTVITDVDAIEIDGVIGQANIGPI